MNSDQKIVSEMLSTLDVSKYNLLSKETQIKLIQKIEKKEGLNPQQEILLSLLKNFLTKDSPTKDSPTKDTFEYPKYILGPHYLVKMELKTETKEQSKIIYFFGELHDEISETASCKGSFSRITPFLEKIFKTAYKPIDFFLEVTPIERYTEGIKGKIKETELILKPSEQFQDIHLLREKFQHCYSRNKKKCPYTGVRVHYTDVRFLDSFPVLSFDLTDRDPFDKILRILKRNLEVELPMIKEPLFFKKLYKQFRYIPSSEIRKVLVNYLGELMVNYQKAFFGEINFLKPDEKPDEKLKYFDAEYQDLVSTLKKNLTIPKELLQYKNVYEKFVSFHKIVLYAYLHKDLVLDKPGLRNSTIVLLEESLDFFESFNELFLDIYTLSRMFRTYSPFHEARNIIFYGGSFHSKNMVRLLESTGMFKKTIFPVYGESPGCIDISEMRGKMF